MCLRYCKHNLCIFLLKLSNYACYYRATCVLVLSKKQICSKILATKVQYSEK